MKVLNICVNGAYTDGFSYHENMLPKYHKLIGHDVSILASKYEFNGFGQITKADTERFIDVNGIEVIRLDIKGNKSIRTKFKRFDNFYQALERINPDIIFCHLFQFLDLALIVKYVKRNKNVKLFIDSHADSKNSGRNLISRILLHGLIWRRLAHKALPFAEKFIGVTPARVDFLINTYKLPRDKVELLPLGADDEIVAKATQPQIRDKKRKDYGLFESDFIIITGGKIDHNKPQTIAFMEAVNRLEVPNVRLLVFGLVSDDLKSAFDEQLSDKVKYIGWKKSEEIYYEFAAADLVVFPGLHSVLWEQAVGMGKPCIFKDIKGFHHIDLGGNCLFFENDSVEEYVAKIMQAKANLDSMRDVAEESGMKYFSYKEIAKKSIGM